MKINDDIDILNQNQDKIIEFIHENFNAKPKKMEMDNEDIGEEDDSNNFIELFKTQIKLKVN